jgi:hypothetical protein
MQDRLSHGPGQAQGSSLTSRRFASSVGWSPSADDCPTGFFTRTPLHLLRQCDERMQPLVVLDEQGDSP